jgi:hypothetical protein
MAYVPPHLRKAQAHLNQDDFQIQKKKKGKEQKTQENKEKKQNDEFPVLAPVSAPKKSTMDFKELFARRKEIKKRQKKMKYGWVHLTKNGIIDSLTPEQREQENVERNERKMEHAMIDLAYRIERDTERRIQFEDLEPIVLDEYSTEEEYVSSEESYVDEDEEYDSQ